MPARRVVVAIDSKALTLSIQAELTSWRAWLARERCEVSTGFVTFGRSASWLLESTSSIIGSRELSAVGTSEQPNLELALSVAANGPRSQALVTLLAREPRSDWQRALEPNTFPFRACVSCSNDPVSALGSGHLGANFRREHLGLALRWLTSEVCDRSYFCECGRVLIYGDNEETCGCGARPPLPPRLRIRGRVVLLVPGTRLYPHHLGRPLDFERPVASLEDIPLKDGHVVIDGVNAEVRTTPALSRSGDVGGRFRAPSIFVRTDRCSACEGELLAPVLHQAPDPRRYCATCSSRLERCDFCEVPLGAVVRAAWPDGRTVCPECWNTAVTEITELENLARLSRRWLERRVGMTVPPCPLHFEHAATIARYHGQVFQPGPGRTPRVLGFYRRPQDGGDPAIFVEHGTPLAILYGVVTHELTHAWQWDYWPREVAPTLREGLAMWTEYQALLDAGAIHAARHAELYGDPIYGLGFRVALAVEKEHGFQQVKTKLCQVTAVTVS